jgi:phosphoribulokinase
VRWQDSQYTAPRDAIHHALLTIASRLFALATGRAPVALHRSGNPFIARTIPAAGESMAATRFANPRGIDMRYRLSMLHDSFMSGANTLVGPGGKMALAMRLIFTPMIMWLVERRRKALAG